MKIQHTGVQPLAGYDPALVKYSTVAGIWLARRDIEFCVLRLDLGTRWAMGNKVFKLGNNLRQLALDDVRRVLSFGGAWSNHLLALAQAAQAVGIESVGCGSRRGGFRQQNAGPHAIAWHAATLHQPVAVPSKKRPEVLPKYVSAVAV